jgi:hypothetical protein
MRPAAEYAGTLVEMSLLGSQWLVVDGQQLTCPVNLQTRNDLLGQKIRVRGIPQQGWKVVATHIKRMDALPRRGWEALA